jgi:hypothetical protein
MNHKASSTAHKISSRMLSIIFTLCASVLPWGAVVAQVGSTYSFSDQLKERYKTTEISFTGNNATITRLGSVLVVQRGDILAAANSLDTPVQIYRDGKLRDRKVTIPTYNSFNAGSGAKLFQVGEKVYIKQIEVILQKETVSFLIVECDSCNGGVSSSYKASLAFQFSKGYLENADIDKVADVISQALTIDSGDSKTEQRDQSHQVAQEHPGDQASVQAQPVVQIDVGQTIEQVKATLGEPEKIVNLGVKQIYIYRDLKITFVSGKVSDVQ